MIIKFKSNKLEKSLLIPKDIQKTYGTMAKKVNQRMKEFTAASDLSVIKSLPGTDFHRLSGPRKSQYSVSITGNWRIILEPETTKIKSESDLKKITSIKIIEVIDYH